MSGSRNIAPGDARTYPVPDHELEINVMYFANDDCHKWRAVCTCGFQSRWERSPRTAELELKLHRRTYPKC